MGTMHYVTAVPIPRMAPQEMDRADLSRLPRVDLAKFFTEQDAADHMEKLSPTGFYEPRVEARPDPEADEKVDIEGTLRTKAEAAQIARQLRTLK
jgi:hypothetical protein